MLPTRSAARQVVESGNVLVGGAVARKPARLVAAGEPIVVEWGRRFVSRGGDKLDGALERFALDVDGDQVLDAGASTGGFTDCLLQRGAGHVVALDVGHGQLHERIANDDRVTVLERTNVRDLGPRPLGPFDTVVADLSFISLTVVLPSLMAVVRPGGRLVLLVKPQFESDRVAASKGRGVIRDPVLWRKALERVVEVAEDLGARLEAAACSPLQGARGNREFFVHLRRVPDGEPAPGGECAPADGAARARILHAAVAEAG